MARLPNGKQAAAVNKRSLIYENVLEYLKAELIKGHLKPGDQLPTVAAMAAQLNVNGASVREAYRVLETLGMLSVTQGRGTFVTSALDSHHELLSHLQFAEQQSIVHLLETRKVLEPELAALAAVRATQAEADAIVVAAHEMETLARAGEDFIDPDIRFHELIFLAAHNPVMAKILSALSGLFLDSRRLTSRLPGATEKAIHFHNLIAIAIQENNPTAARALMFQHIDDVERSLARHGTTALRTGDDTT